MNLILYSNLILIQKQQKKVFESDSEAKKLALPPIVPNPEKQPKSDPLRWSTVLKENIYLKELSFTENLPAGQLQIQELFNYFRYTIACELTAYIVSESNIYISQIGINKPLKLT